MAFLGTGILGYVSLLLNDKVVKQNDRFPHRVGKAVGAVMRNYEEVSQSGFHRLCCGVGFVGLLDLAAQCDVGDRSCDED